MDKKLGMMNGEWMIHDESMPVVKETMHMGILRSHCTEESAVTENTKKSRRTVYSLMSSGLHRSVSFRPRVVSALRRFGPGSFRPGSFRPNLVSRFGLIFFLSPPG